MPAVVDHEERRQKIADIVSQLISREGMDAVTIREVAAAAGFSTTIVTHYFATKRELLLYTYEAAANHAQLRVDRVFAKDAGDLQGYLEALLPLDRDSLRDWRVYFAFWQIAAIDSAFSKVQRRRMVEVRETIRRIIELRSGDGKALVPAADLIGKRLLTLLLGIAVQAIFDPKGWSAQRQKAFLAEELERIAQAASATI